MVSWIDVALGGPSPAPWLEDAACQRIVSAYASGLRRIMDRYGARSRAAYVVKYTMATEVFALLVERRRSSPERASAIAELFEGLRIELVAHFAASAPAGAGSARHPVERLERTVQGRSWPLYRAEVVVDPGQVARLRPHIIRVDALRAATLRHGGTYLYCISSDGEILLYDRPLHHEELLVGAMHDTIAVKHPLLVYDCDLTVRCAGELCPARAPGGGLGGVIMSRGSGHFRPDPDALPSIIEAARTQLGLDPRDVAVIG